MQLFETGDGVLAVEVWLLRACGRRLTQTRLPARRNRNRWRLKMRHLSKALKPPPTTLPTLLPLSSTGTQFFSPSCSRFLPLMIFFQRLLKSTCCCQYLFWKRKKLLGCYKVSHVVPILGTLGALGHPLV